MATVIHFQPTLFVFLGTSAGQVGWRLKNLLTSAYGDLPILRYLWVDTDRITDLRASEWFSDPNERVELSGFNGDVVLANVDSYPSIQAWWPDNTRLKPGYIQRGAKQIRLYGRLALFRMYDDRTSGPAFIDKLSSATSAMKEIENKTATEDMSTEEMQYKVDEGTRVVIVFSTCGGTGSSMAFDLAYLCRHLLQGDQPTVIGMAVLPPVIDRAMKSGSQTQREKIRANTYAWFRENEHLVNNPHWHVKYPEGAAIDIPAPPFNQNFVLDVANQAGDRLNSEDDVYTLAAQAIFLDTGSSIGGAIRGFNANVQVLMEEYEGRQRIYSSLAAAALVYPTEKILNYCSARLGQEMIREGALAKPKSEEVEKTASALMGRLRLRDNQLMIDLLADRHVSDHNIPAIRKANTTEKIRGLLSSQESQNTEERARQIELVGDKAARLLQEDQEDLPIEIRSIALSQGARFAQAVLEALISDQDISQFDAESIFSLVGYKKRLSLLGESEEDLRNAEEQYRAARERLRSLEGDPKMALLRLVSKRSWQRNLDGARNDCLHWMNEVNQLSLNLAAKREAANTYDQLVNTLEAFKGSLAEMVQTLNRSEDSLEKVARENLKPGSAQENIYELWLEAVDAEHIQEYYQEHGRNIDGETAYRAFAREMQEQGPQHTFSWSENDLAAALMSHAQGYFAEDIQNTSLLEALREYHGEDAAQVIESQFDRLVRHCQPFWKYHQDRGIKGLEGKSIIGVEDENSDLIPPRYQKHENFEIKSTGFKHEIYATRIRHGLPAFLLRDMEEFKTYYDQKRSGIDPLHVIQEVAFAEEVIPEEKQEARHLFAVAAAFDYIVKLGSWYYFDPQKGYTKDEIHPGKKYQLGQGHENAEEKFVQRDDFVQEAEELIESEIVRMGNEAAKQLLEERIQEHKQSLADMGIDNQLRPRIEKEIAALRKKQEQLGFMGER